MITEENILNCILIDLINSEGLDPVEAYYLSIFYKSAPVVDWNDLGSNWRGDLEQ